MTPRQTDTPPEAAGIPKVAAPGETIMNLHDRFQRERAAAASPDTWTQNRKILLRFSEFVGPNALISVVNRKTVRSWKRQLEKMAR